jgi:hypothetical protein
MTEAELRTALAAQGLGLRDADVAATLATARFLMQAAALVQQAAR